MVVRPLFSPWTSTVPGSIVSASKGSLTHARGLVMVPLFFEQSKGWPASSNVGKDVSLALLNVHMLFTVGASA
tara:strand:+ start:750 stop:968 length:219 start_codon:yes stop_codon:yes gene_type:complete